MVLVYAVLVIVVVHILGEVMVYTEVAVVQILNIFMEYNYILEI